MIYINGNKLNDGLECFQMQAYFLFSFYGMQNKKQKKSGLSWCFLSCFVLFFVFCFFYVLSGPFCIFIVCFLFRFNVSCLFSEVCFCFCQITNAVMVNNNNKQQHHDVATMHDKLKQLLFFNERQKKVINDEPKAHNVIVENIITKKINNSIKRTNKSNDFTNILKMELYNCDCAVNWTEQYFFETVGVLLIIFCHTSQKECVKLRTGNDKMHEKRKDNKNNRKNKSHRNGVYILINLY